MDIMCFLKVLLLHAFFVVVVVQLRRWRWSLTSSRYARKSTRCPVHGGRSTPTTTACARGTRRMDVAHGSPRYQICGMCKNWYLKTMLEELRRRWPCPPPPKGYEFCRFSEDFFGFFKQLSSGHYPHFRETKIQIFGQIQLKSLTSIPFGGPIGIRLHSLMPDGLQHLQGVGITSIAASERGPSSWALGRTATSSAVSSASLWQPVVCILIETLNC